jgi:hypothetical protein
MFLSHRSSARPLPPGRRARIAGAVAALLASSGLISAVLGAFYLASAQPWLLPTPDVLEAAADCRTLRTRVEHEACLAQLVAARTQAPRDARLAAASTPGSRR